MKKHIGVKLVEAEPEERLGTQGRVWTRAEIQNLYKAKSTGAYRGKEAEFKAICQNRLELRLIKNGEAGSHE